MGTTMHPNTTQHHETQPNATQQAQNDATTKQHKGMQ